MEDVTGGKVKIGNTTYTMVEAKYNGSVVWPTSVTTSYTVTAAHIVFYLNGSETYNYDHITADGSVYAKVFGDVDVYENGVKVRTLSWVQLETRVSSGTSLYVSNNEIHGPDWYTTEASSQTATVMASYQTSYAYSAGTITQEANVKTLYDTQYGEKQYGTETVVREYDYHSSISANHYTTSIAQGCPANGSTGEGGSGYNVTLSFGTCYHLKDTLTPWTRTVTDRYKYTATGNTLWPEAQSPQTGSDPNTYTVSDTPTLSGGATGFNRSGMTVTIESEGTDYENGRSATYVATNGTATASVTIYQQANTRTTTYSYDLAIEIYPDGNLSYKAMTYAVSGRSQRVATTSYASGAPSTSQTQSVESTISTTNCTAHNGSGTPISTVSGYFGFAIDVAQNTGAARTVSVGISAGGVTASDPRTQDAYTPPQQNKATIMPFVPNFTVAGMYQFGKVYTMFTVTEGTVTSATLTGTVLHYKKINSQGSLESSVQIGSLTVSEATPFPELVATGVPTFQSGDTIEVWFSATGTGVIDQMTYQHYEVSL